MAALKSIVLAVFGTLSFIIAAVFFSGVYDPFLCTYSFRLVGCPTPLVKGTHLEDFPKTVKALELALAKGNLGNMQLSMWKDGKEILNLYGIYYTPEYNDKSLHFICSSAKVLSSIVIGILVDRGLLNLNDKISKYWPEFAANGKENFTVAELMRHEVGLQRLSHKFVLEKYVHNGYKNEFAPLIIETPPKFYPGSPRFYHGWTRGFIENEIVKRVDPQHRNVRDLFNEEVANKLNAECWFGLAPEHRHRLAQPKSPSALKGLVKIFLPYFLGMLPRTMAHGLDVFLNPINKETVATDSEVFTPEQFMTPEMFDIVSPSTHAFCTARGKGMILSMLANGGKLGDVEILSEKTWRTMTNISTPARIDHFFQMQTIFTDGGWSVSIGEKEQRNLV